MAGFKGGMGGGNMQNLMKQAQKMQEQLQETEKLLEDWEIVGTSGGEAVVVYMNAKKIIDGIELDAKVVDPEDVESRGRGNAGGPHHGGDQRRLQKSGRSV